MKFYANRQVSTGWFLPAGGRWNRVPGFKHPPRLFVKQEEARKFLREWLTGKYEYRDYDERRLDDFETVLVELTMLGVAKVVEKVGCP